MTARWSAMYSLPAVDRWILSSREARFTSCEIKIPTKDRVMYSVSAPLLAAIGYWSRMRL